MITQRFAVEFDRRTVGIAVRVPGGFMFYASDDRFDPMDGRLFRRARAIERELKRVASRRQRARPAFSRSPRSPDKRVGRTSNHSNLWSIFREQSCHPCRRNPRAAHRPRASRAPLVPLPARLDRRIARDPRFHAERPPPRNRPADQQRQHPAPARCVHGRPRRAFPDQVERERGRDRRDRHIHRGLLADVGSWRREPSPQRRPAADPPARRRVRPGRRPRPEDRARPAGGRGDAARGDRAGRTARPRLRCPTDT